MGSQWVMNGIFATLAGSDGFGQFATPGTSIVLAGGSWLAALCSHLVPKRHRAGLVGLDLRQMESDVPVELLEELDPIPNQDRQNRIANFVRQSETKAFGGDHPASHKPDRPESGP